jgi:hypothetical protein
LNQPDSGHGSLFRRASANDLPGGQSVGNRAGRRSKYDENWYMLLKFLNESWDGADPD